MLLSVEFCSITRLKKKPAAAPSAPPFSGASGVAFAPAQVPRSVIKKVLKAPTAICATRLVSSSAPIVGCALHDGALHDDRPLAPWPLGPYDPRSFMTRSYHL